MLPVVVVPGATPSTTVIVPAPNGWIAMPQDHDLLTTDLFTPNLNRITLDSTAIATWTPIDVGAISAGKSTAPAGLAADRFFGIRMRVRQVGVPASETDGGTCHRLAIDSPDPRKGPRRPALDERGRRRANCEGAARPESAHGGSNMRARLDRNR